MYYEPHASRTNLIVMTSAQVTRASLSKAAGGEATAESVCFLYKGNEYQALVKKEVILSAGYASRSPRGMGQTLICTWLFQGNHVSTGIRASSPLVSVPHISAGPRALRDR
jgi:hypothetical protein